jgi:AAHS family 3-hydroxyphenylpropionic acid transporter
MTPTKLSLTVGLCFIVALLEGIDIQAAGIAGPGIAAHFGLGKTEMGWVFSASILGLLPGSFVGGVLADRVGRKTVLIASVLLFGVFSIATSFAWNLPSLLAVRVLTGIGLGAALPNLIALSSEAAGDSLKATAVSLMYCGVPLGGATASLVTMFSGANHWELVFHIGGWAPILVAPLLYRFLPESHSFQSKKRPYQPGNSTVAIGLFSSGQVLPTVALWLSCFFTLTVVYMLLNWLPTLLASLGFSRPQVGVVQLLLNMGMACGSIMAGVLLDRWYSSKLIVLIYGGVLLSLFGLAVSGSFPSMAVAGFTAGFFILAAQLMLYALAPQFYPTEVRATGVGAAVCVGRLGSISGPLIAGQMLASGSGVAGLMLAAAPGILAAAMGVAVLIRCGQCRTELSSN